MKKYTSTNLYNVTERHVSKNMLKNSGNMTFENLQYKISHAHWSVEYNFNFESLYRYLWCFHQDERHQTNCRREIWQKLTCLTGCVDPARVTARQTAAETRTRLLTFTVALKFTYLTKSSRVTTYTIRYHIYIKLWVCI